MAFDVNETHLFRVIPDRLVLVLDDDEFDILEQSGEFISFFQRGRSVYKPQIGSQYEPARIYFGRVLHPQEAHLTDYAEIRILLDSPIRRR